MYLGSAEAKHTSGVLSLFMDLGVLEISEKYSYVDWRGWPLRTHCTPFEQYILR